MLIGQEARIITVCYFYDVLTAYRAAMPVEKALSIIDAEIGKAIDGNCFEALNALVRREALAQAEP